MHKEQIKKIIIEFEHFFSQDLSTHINEGNVGLLSGRCSLLFSNAILCLNNETLDRSIYIDEHIEYIIETLDENSNLFVSLSNGIAGVGFCLHYIQENNLSEYDLEDTLEEIDEILEDTMYETGQNENNFDPLHGSIGIALYLIKRKKYFSSIAILVQKIYDKIIKDEHEFKWQTYDQFRTKKMVYDFGLAHGNASLLFFLSKCYNHNINSDLSKDMMYNIISFYNRNEQKIEETGSIYPSSISVESYSSNKQSFSRLAWCYGDLGALHALFFAATSLEDKLLIKHFKDLIIQTTSRKEPAETIIKDACFCHGSAGLAHIYSKLSKKIDDYRVKEAATYWLKETLGYKKSDDVFFSLRDDVENINYMSLLDGVTGVSSVLCSIDNIKIKEWDSFLLLS
ncbi:lanthionine synthetase LanC family protein [uncultured Dokdonia sp.]|uniref:lanthionine synthetase LanC family protein n=1 Tax=uncultured Dokdonia sp. TaxID=575653 RepID=UPI002603756E|nr:lanthionine synthetase LanC family protein [uncultured Dokdonia sp.]